jgi:hypothetical protein
MVRLGTSTEAVRDCKALKLTKVGLAGPVLLSWPRAKNEPIFANRCLNPMCSCILRCLTKFRVPLLKRCQNYVDSSSEWLTDLYISTKTILQFSGFLTFLFSASQGPTQRKDICQPLLPGRPCGCAAHSSTRSPCVISGRKRNPSKLLKRGREG